MTVTAPIISFEPELDDATLVARAAAGDDQAFTKLYRRHARYIAGVAYRLLGSDAALDDVVQETFLAASRQLTQIERPEHFRWWLVRVAVRNVDRRVKRDARARNARQSIQPPRTTRKRVSEEVVALYEALGQLPPKLRTPWVLRQVEGMTLPEVAEVTQSSVATTKRRLREAEERMRRRLDG